MRETKINAIKNLLEFSFLFSLDQKDKILAVLDKFTDEQLDGLGKILAVEHRNRDRLNKKSVEDIMSSLDKYL